MTAHRIRRGVSLYSFQEEYFLRTLSLEDCVRVAGEIGARGIEIIPEQSIPGFPRLSDEFVDTWFSWMEQYGTTPVATDLFLDTSPYGAHTTASDALWMGVPVLTVRGRGFASRVCASLVTAAGLPEMICERQEDYVERAVLARPA